MSNRGMVTRSFTVNKVEYLEVIKKGDKKTLSNTQTIEFFGNKLNETQALKAVCEEFKQSNFMIESVSHEEVILGMTHDDFIKNAVKVERPASQKKTEEVKLEPQTQEIPKDGGNK